MTSSPAAPAGATLVVHTEGVIALPLETWATIGTLLTAILALYAALRHDITVVRGDIQRLETRVDRVEDRVGRLEHRLEDRFDRLDDRVYALAAGLRPQVEAARADDA